MDVNACLDVPPPLSQDRLKRWSIAVREQQQIKPDKQTPRKFAALILEACVKAEGVSRREQIDEWAGYPSAIAAAGLGWSETEVRKERLGLGRDPNDGEYLRHDPRTIGKQGSRNQRIVDLKAAGATNKTIAAEVGLSPMQVGRILSGARA